MHRLDIGAETGAHPRVLLLAPSGGLGGGTERYLGTVEERLRAGGAVVHRVDLRVPARPLDARARARFAVGALRAARQLAPVDAVLAGHPGLTRVAAAAVLAGRARRAPVLVDDTDGPLPPTARMLLAHTRVFLPLAASSYAAGTLRSLGAVPVLRPGLTPAWRAVLLAAGARVARAAETRTGQTGPRLAVPPIPPRAQDETPTVLVVTRLDSADWPSRGLPELLAALVDVRRAVGPVRLVVAGRGPVREDLRAALSAVGGVGPVDLVESPDDAALAALYATADVCVEPSGTGPAPARGDRGLVLTEAQLAGCPVVGPVTGPSREVYLDGVTGATPPDATAAALAATITQLLQDRARLTRMRRRAAEWARMATEPGEHTRAVFAAVLGRAPVHVPDPPAPAGWTAPASPRPRWPVAAVAAQRRPAAQVWPERERGLPDVDDVVTDDLETGRGWSEDIEADDLAGL